MLPNLPDLRHICVREIYSCDHQRYAHFLRIMYCRLSATRCLSHQLFPLWRRVHDSNVCYGITIGRISSPLRYHYANSPYLIELRDLHPQETELDLRALCFTNGLISDQLLLLLSVFFIIRTFKRFSLWSKLRRLELSYLRLFRQRADSYTKFLISAHWPSGILHMALYSPLNHFVL